MSAGDRCFRTHQERLRYLAQVAKYPVMKNALTKAADEIDRLESQLAAERKAREIANVCFRGQLQRAEEAEEALISERKARDLAEFSWAGCSQQLKDAISDLEETEQALEAERIWHRAWAEAPGEEKGK